MFNRSRALSLLAASFGLVAGAPAVAAFPTGTQFDLDALSEDGGGGRSFAGGPSEANLTCAVCHTDGPERVGIRLEADQEEMFRDGYRPDRGYRMRVVLLRDWAAHAESAFGDDCGATVAPYRRCDENGFALTMVDARGNPAGSLAPSCDGAPGASDVRLMDDGRAITHGGAAYAQTTWSFCWIAPGAGAGAVTAYLAVVDGGGGDGTIAFPEDMTGDDTAAGAVDLREYHGSVPEVDGGCSASAEPSWATALLLTLAGAIRRRRRLARPVVVLGLVLGVSGCVAVKPHQKQDLARRKMTFAPFPTEDELDLHMQQSREGSAGGYGNAGGGCGCN